MKVDVDDTNGQCFKCPTGFYGATCTQECSLCKNQLCDLRQCREACIGGYFLSNLDDSKSCQKCSANCRECEAGNICLKCYNGFYEFNYKDNNGNNLTTCQSCPSNCEECDDYSKCTACKPEKYGSFCDKTCPEGCSTCGQTNGSCKICHRDKYGDNCQLPCNEHCKDDGNILSLCNKDSGKCELGCIDGYSDSRCDLAQTTPPSAKMTSAAFWRSSESTPATSTQAESGTATTESLQSSEDGKTEFFFFGMLAGIGVGVIIETGIGFLYLKLIRRRQNSTKTQGSDQREYVNTVGMSVIASPETKNNSEHQGNVGAAATSSHNVYESLETGVREEENSYTGLE